MTWDIVDNEFIFDTQTINAECDEMAILHFLTDNGLGAFVDGKCYVPVEAIYELSDGQRRLLSLPQEYPYYLNIKSSGLINQPDFKYIVTFSVSKEYGTYTVLIKNLPVVTLRSSNGVNNQFLLPETQYRLLNEIASFDETQKSSSSEGYKSLSRIKSLAESDASILLSDYLNGYNIVEADSVSLGLDYKDGIFEIIPDISDEIAKEHGIRQNEFTSKFDKRARVLSVYTLNGDNNTEHKVLIPEESAEKLSELKSAYRRISDPDKISQIIETPELFLDESYFDLKEFYSDRVIEIGLYKPTFYSFVSPYQSQWIPGFKIEDRFNGTTNVFLNSYESIEQLERAIVEAELQGKKQVLYRGYNIDIEEARRFVEIARAQLAKPYEPVETQSDGKKVLIIEENAESLGYTEDGIDVETPKEYIFHQIENLRKEIILKPHQNAGVAWLQYLVETKSKGCILADDMGLGKTLQVLCFIDWHNKHINHGKKPYLIVAPVSLLDNWNKEIIKFLEDGSYNPVILHGGMISKKPNQDDVDWLSSQDIILTNYETVRGSQFNICAVDYAVVVLDEAQKIKTPGTYVTCAAKALKADFKIAMTGTPVENTYLDLWCIMDFAIPGLLGNSKEFAAQYQHPLKEEGTDVEALGKELRDKMGVFFLRRRKIDVLKDLPQKRDIKSEVYMTPIQENAYINAIIQAQKCEGLDEDQGRMLMLILLNYLRQISDSSLLMDNKQDLEILPVEALIESSAKVKETIKILDEIRARDEKVIIFCIYKESQRILQRVIHDRYGISAKIINGDTKVLTTARCNNGKYSRQQAIDSFEAIRGFNVIIMSPIAAGMGLNVTAANNVIHFGRHWNPAKESQATDRAYRIGQEKDVNVYYPITKLSDKYGFASFEQTLDNLLNRKTNLAEATLFPSEQAEVKMADFQEFMSNLQAMPHAHSINK